MAAPSKAWVSGCSLAGDRGIEYRREHGCFSLVSVVCCQVEVSASRWSLVQRSHTECGVSNECGRETPQGEIMAKNRVEAPWGGEGEESYTQYMVRINLLLFL